MKIHIEQQKVISNTLFL